MDLAAVIQEGERFAKPSLLLTDQPTNGQVVAYWGGTGRTTLPAQARYLANAEHRITLDCAWLGQYHKQLRGTLSVYVSSTDDRGLVFFDPQTQFQDIKIDGLPLYGIEQESFPPLQALCLYGGSAVEEWINSLGLTKYDYDAIENTELGRQYQAEWMNRCPFYSNEYVAVVGGWHMQWPNDDFYMPAEMRLVVWTFRDAEPWIEVWERLPNFRVGLRTT